MTATAELRAALKATYHKGLRRKLAMRDGWVCQICLWPIDPRLKHPDRWSATLDHVVPLSEGGSDDMANLRLAHRYCNRLRGSRPAMPPVPGLKVFRPPDDDDAMYSRPSVEVAPVETEWPF